jgi:hypothetical protein
MSNTKPEHSPLPWEVGHGDGRRTTAICFPEHETGMLVPMLNGSYELQQANAVFICKAVNNHDKLVESLCELLADHRMHCTDCPLVKRAEALLAAVNKEE